MATQGITKDRFERYRIGWEIFEGKAIEVYDESGLYMLGNGW